MINQDLFDVGKYKKILLKTFKAFVDICEKNNLRYFCAGGTVLGAVRHNGFIPWDDDIDVFMPAEDYYKLITIESSYVKEGYSIISARNSDSFATFAKFYNKNTTLWEFKEIPFVYGIYIDIFPLYESSDDLDTFLVKYRKLRNVQRLYQLSQMRFTFQDIISYYDNGDKKYFYKGIMSLFVPHSLSKCFRKRIIELEDSFNNEKGKNIVCPYGEYYAKEYQQKKWYDSYEEHVFEDMMVRLPSDYNAFLTHVYGDYMKLPPKEKQVSHHYHYYLNMDKGMTLEQVKSVMK